MIINENAGNINEFSVFFKKYSDPEAALIAPPCKQRDQETGINGYWAHLPGYGFMVKVDSRNYSTDISKFLLSPNQPLFLVIDNLKKSPEFSRILDFIHDTEN
ncbi:hypothetical protein [Picosynechococcus sp. NKBG15041c]|uniref:hypothetical protein n=1 Tax=Picosynechococcus sp. NKBG15041c TaxID=1407650 RepID=UPI000466EE9E|nr:hypothetical protein [Picosynechococcus sp. NKBG15041c]